MNNKGIEFWDRRWQTAASPAEGSWEGDGVALSLEAEFIAAALKKTRGGILDIGCGAGTLFDGGRAGHSIEWEARQRGYKGIDGSRQAIEQAMARFEGPRLKWEVADLDSGYVSILPSEECVTVVSRRTIQNLTPGRRLSVIESLLDFEHGIILEASLLGLEYTNSVRRIFGHPELTQPEFNSFLTEEEFKLLAGKKGAVRTWPLANYYGITRGVLNCRNLRAAAEACDGRPEPNCPMGILSGIVW